MTLRLVTWNVAWKKRSSASGRELAARIARQAPHLVCLTESHLDFLEPEGGHVVAADPNYGYRDPDGGGLRRKVVLWSRSPWREVDRAGGADLPEGRFVSAVTDTNLGPVRIIGVCIPWPRAHVPHGERGGGRRDRKPWEEHLLYLAGLERILQDTAIDMPCMVVGDFNQRIPRSRAPQIAYAALMEALHPRFMIATPGVLADAPGQGVDHVAVSRGIAVRRTAALSHLDHDGKELSDHFGVAVECEADPGQEPLGTKASGQDVSSIRRASSR